MLRVETSAGRSGTIRSMQEVTRFVVLPTLVLARGGVSVKLAAPSDIQVSTRWLGSRNGTGTYSVTSVKPCTCDEEGSPTP